MTFFLLFLLVLGGLLPAQAEVSAQTSPTMQSQTAPKSTDPRTTLFQRSSQDLITGLKDTVLHECHPNKRFVYSLFFNQTPKRNATITVSTVPNTLDRESPHVAGFLRTIGTKQAFKTATHEVFFPYTLSPPESDTLLVTLNFADGDLFGFYKSGLLAQDELQVLEFPELALMREHLKLTNPELLKANTTSMIIHNVQRFCVFDTQKYIKGKTMYGNSFHKALPEEILQRLTVLQKPQTATILPVLAPNVCLHPIYTPQSIEFFLKNLIVGFGHARHFAHTVGRSKLVIHSGGIGTGAFGHHKIASIFLQLIAAQCVAGTNNEVIDPQDFCITFFHTPPQLLAAAYTLFEEFKTNITARQTHTAHNAIEIILQLLSKYNLTPHAGTGE